MRLKANGNVFVTSSGYAYDACKAASPIHKVSAMQKHRRKKIRENNIIIIIQC